MRRSALVFLGNSNKVYPLLKQPVSSHSVTTRCRTSGCAEFIRCTPVLCSSSSESAADVQPLPVSIHPVRPREFFSLPTSGSSSKRREYSERRLLGYSMDQMFDIVSAVEEYTTFVPYCTDSVILSRRPSFLKARMAIGFGPVRESYVSSVTLARPHLVKAVCTEGRMFNHLQTVWKFAPGLAGNERTCTLDFSVSFEFRSALHSRLANMFFDEVVRQMVNAFLREAQRRHGRESIRSQKPKILTAS